MALTAAELKPYMVAEDATHHSMAFMVDGIHCAACMAKLEQALLATAGITTARLNLTTKRVKVVWQGTPAVMLKGITHAAKAGYILTPYNPETLENKAHAHEAWLLRCLAVAGFGSMNVMLLSVAMWGGAMPPHQLALMQWFSALITLPTIAYAGQPYFQAAAHALKNRRTSMEVPISIALILTTALSVFDTTQGHGETYFESAVMLLFFLLTGRYLEARVQGHSRNAAEHLMGLQHHHVAVLGKQDKITMQPSATVPLGALVLWRQGERLGVDGTIHHTTPQGHSHIDTSLLTGESLPREVAMGDSVQAGMVNRGDTLTVKVTAVGQATVLAELARLTDNATSVKNNYTRLADRMARAYAPVVHSMALLTFILWQWLGLDWHESLLRAAAVLIVTCPCALALAIPTVHVAIIGRLLRQGVILKSGDALEKLAEVDTVVLDKTGTLTTGHLQWLSGGTVAERTLAARMALASRHPVAQALVRAVPPTSPLPHTKEIAGQGLQSTYKNHPIRLGSAAFCGVKNPPARAPHQAEVWLKIGANSPIRLLLQDTLRPHAAEAISQLQQLNLQVRVLSGDTPANVQALTSPLGIEGAEGHATPQRKQQVLAQLLANHRTVMMVGDGLNDAPSLALAPVGVSFGKATDLAKLSADIILQQESLLILPRIWHLAKVAKRGVFVNFGMSLAYNVVAIPLAVAGFITPLWAAVLMSASSIMVVANAARLGRE
ncbi:MAG: heavy metal translocating P-type ATPase [Alphaproteobacteria bacterium]